MTALPSYRPVVVTWRDITTLNGWVDPDHIDSFVMDDQENIVHQAGFLYEEDENQIILFNSYFVGKEILGDVTKIPKAVIIDLKYI